jgi:hypothetical protein
MTSKEVGVHLVDGEGETTTKQVALHCSMIEVQSFLTLVLCPVLSNPTTFGEPITVEEFQGRGYESKTDLNSMVGPRYSLPISPS